MRVIALLAALCLAASTAIARDIVAAGTQFRFATAAQTRQALVTDDEWMAAAGAFQRAATVGRRGPVTTQAFKAFLASTAVDCPPEDIQRWSAAIGTVAARFEELKLHLPATVGISCTNGADASGAPYTRGDTVFLPRGLKVGNDALLMAHELFHIWSRRNPGRADQLYALLGFTPAPPLAWPAEWRELRIANPDAPLDRHAIRIDTPDGVLRVMPLLVARRTDIQPGESFFSVMDVRLLAVETAPDGRSSIPQRRDGQLVWFDADRSESYLRQLGGNTRYTIHPEEAAADNVAFLVSGRPVANQLLLDRFRQVLLASSPEKRTP